MSGHEELRNSVDWQNQLYTRYHQKVFGICLYFLKDREEAKDATHDVFIKAFKAWKDFEWKCDPLTWIGAIAKHDCFSRRQRFRKHLDRRVQLAAEEEVLNPNEPEEDLTLHRIRLEKLLPGVRGKLREILRLSLEQGLNHREIAVRMGVSRVAITRRLTRFKKELQEVGRSRDFAIVRGGAHKPRITREPVRAKSMPVVAPSRAHALELAALEAERHSIAA
jgi:RNA polymerase sigma-70 factor (ECF subfamily)